MEKNTWIELDTTALQHNLLAARRALHIGTELYFVVKADAYGHGMAPVAHCATQAGISHFAVAHVEEGIALRTLAPQATILVLCAPPPDTVPELYMHNLIPLIAGPAHGTAIADAVQRLSAPEPLACDIKIDTGMSRLGYDWTRAPEEITPLARTKGLRLRGIASHMASSGGDNPRQAALQSRRFVSVVAACRRRGLTFAVRHISASGGFCENPQWDMDAVRLGMILYGYIPGRFRDRIKVRPVLQWKTRILQVKALPRGRTIGYGHTHNVRRRERIATLAAGYADGYSRKLSNRGFVLIHGCRCPVVGRVSMNLTTVSLPAGCHAQAGDTALLIGQQERESVWADKLAELCGTIPYEILTSIRCRPL